MAEINFTKNQKKALELDSGKLVLAGAGSGKTTVMAERYLRLLSEKKKKPGQVVAVTFTRKAAANLEEKIRKEIRKKTEIDSKNRDFWLEINREMQWARIGTIHSFLTGILKTYPFEAGIDPDFIIVGEDAKSSSKELEKLLIKKLYKNDPLFIELFNRFSSFDRLQIACKRLLFNLPLISLLEKYQSSQDTLIRYLDNQSSLLEIDCLDGITEEVDHTQFVQILYTIFNLISPVIQIERERENSELSFDDLEYKTLELLQNNEHVLKQVTTGIHALLIDEFQDTSTIQWELIKLLSSRNGKDIDGNKVFFVGDEKQSIYGFRGANVTNVRAAEDAFITSAQKRDLWTVNLNDNFRTQQNITDKINSLFDKILISGGKEARLYEARAQALNSGRKVPETVRSALEFYYSETGDDQELYSAMASKIRADVLDGSIVVAEEEGGQSPTRNICYTDIGILIRSWKVAPVIEKHLKEKGVPCTIVGGRGFRNKQEVKDIKNLIDAVENPLNKIALIGVLRSPIFSFSDRLIAFLFHKTIDVVSKWAKIHEEPRDTLNSLLIDHEIKDLIDGYSLWNEISRRFRESRPVNAILWTLEASGALAVYATGKNGDQRVANIEKYLDILRGIESKGSSTLTAFREMLAETEQSFAENEAEADVSAGEGVKILTIFGAKGLEFPYVVLPEISSRGKNKPSLENLHSGNLSVEKNEFAVLTDPRLAVFADACPDVSQVIFNRMLETTRRLEEAEEEKRLLYVAMTRAKDRLYLFGHFKNLLGENPPLIKHLSDALGIEVTKRGRKLEINLPDNPEISIAEVGVLINRYCEENNVDPGRERAISQKKIKTYSFNKMTGSKKCQTSFTSFSKFISLHETSTSDIQTDLFTEGGKSSEHGMDIGTIVHNVLQKFGVSAEWGEVLGFVRDELNHYRIENKKEALEAIKALLQNVKTFGLHLIDGKLHREIPVSLQLGDLTLRGKVDLAVYGENTAEVFDYKTNLVVPGEEQQTSKATGYDHQVKLYALCLLKAWQKKEGTGKLLYLYSGGMDSYSVSNKDMDYYNLMAERFIQANNKTEVVD